MVTGKKRKEEEMFTRFDFSLDENRMRHRGERVDEKEEKSHQNEKIQIIGEK